MILRQVHFFYAVKPSKFSLITETSPIDLTLTSHTCQFNRQTKPHKNK